MINLNTSLSHFVFTLNSLTTRSDKGFRGSLIPVTGGGGEPGIKYTEVGGPIMVGCEVKKIFEFSKLYLVKGLKRHLPE